eukprot:g32705.t1
MVCFPDCSAFFNQRLVLEKRTEVMLWRESSTESWGLEIGKADDGLFIQSLLQDSPSIARWHREHPDPHFRIWPAYAILTVNGRETSDEMMEELRSANVVEMLGSSWFSQAVLSLTCAFMALSFVSLFMMSFAKKSTPVTTNFHKIALLVTGIAGVAYLCMALGIGIKEEADGSRVYWIRYVDWTLTTPLMLIELGILANAHRAQTWTLIAIDEFMLAFGIMSSLSVQGKWPLFMAGLLCFSVVGTKLFTSLQKQANALGGEAQILFNFVANRTAEIWCMYPRSAGWFRCRGTKTFPEEIEIAGYAIADVFAKCGIPMMAWVSSMSSAKLSLETTWSISQVRCPEEGCPPVETVLTDLSVKMPRPGAGVYKILKPFEDITKEGAELWLVIVPGPITASTAVEVMAAIAGTNAVLTPAMEVAGPWRTPPTTASVMAMYDRALSRLRGTRLSSSNFVGRGYHSIRIKAAAGPGVVSTFYLSNNGGLYDKTKTHPWVELDFEIMGNMAGGHSRIWTNMFTDIAVEHNDWITVPFDVSADVHEYGFELSDNSIAFKVDGVAYRTVDIRNHQEHRRLPRDVKNAIWTSSLQKFISVWGKSASDPGEGIMEFRNAMGLLNGNHFPAVADYIL